MRLAAGLVGMCGVLLTTAFAAQSDRLRPDTWRVADVPRELRDDVARGTLIAISMQDALIRELQDALSRMPPASAIRSCHVDVVWLVRRITRQAGVAAGRTSDRIRNPANPAPHWTIRLVNANSHRRARDVGAFAVDLGDAVGVLQPIAHTAMCDSCHGTADRIDPAVKAELEKWYPSDRATGFVEGEIRGWFWVEVPKHKP